MSKLHAYNSKFNPEKSSWKTVPMTFMCSGCNTMQKVTGRKFSHMVGRSPRFKCVICLQKELKA